MSFGSSAMKTFMEKSLLMKNNKRGKYGFISFNNNRMHNCAVDFKY